MHLVLGQTRLTSSANVSQPTTRPAQRYSSVGCRAGRSVRCSRRENARPLFQTNEQNVVDVVQVVFKKYQIVCDLTTTTTTTICFVILFCFVFVAVAVLFGYMWLCFVVIVPLILLWIFLHCTSALGKISSRRVYFWSWFLWSIVRKRNLQVRVLCFIW